MENIGQHRKSQTSNFNSRQTWYDSSKSYVPKNKGKKKIQYKSLKTTSHAYKAQFKTQCSDKENMKKLFTETNKESCFDILQKSSLQNRFKNVNMQFCNENQRLRKIINDITNKSRNKNNAIKKQKENQSLSNKMNLQQVLLKSMPKIKLTKEKRK